MEGSLREDLEKAFTEEPGAPAAGGESAPAAPAPASPEPAAKAPEPSVQDGKSAAEDGAGEKSELRLNEERKEPSAAPAAAPAPAAPRAPNSWKPEEREEWSKMSAAQQAAVLRREREIDQGLRTSAEARRFHEEFNQMVQPFQAMIQAENSNPVQAVRNLFATAYGLRNAPPPQKAQIVAQIVKNFGVDVNLLDSALVGALPPPNPVLQQVEQMVEQRLAPLREFEQLRQQSTQRVQDEVANELETFSQDPKNEFFEDVRDDIADILEINARRGRKMTLQDAYDRAIMQHPTISRIVEQRRLAQRVTDETSAARRARGAAASVSGAPSDSVNDSPPDSIRGALEHAIDKAEGRVR